MSREGSSRLGPLLAFVPVDEAAKRKLCDLVGHESRHYHGIDHLALLWERHVHFAAEAKLNDSVSCRMVASAIAYHDAVYDGARSDNERLSADLWWRESEAAGISMGERGWVAETILATADHLGYRPEVAVSDDRLPLRERARFWTLDIDLTPLGEPAEVFDINAAMLRAESPHMSAVEHEGAQRAFLRRMRGSPQIYRSPVLKSAFEAPARRNLARRLDRK